MTFFLRQGCHGDTRTNRHVIRWKDKYRRRRVCERQHSLKVWCAATASKHLSLKCLGVLNVTQTRGRSEFCPKVSRQGQDLCQIPLKQQDGRKWWRVDINHALIVYASHKAAVKQELLRSFVGGRETLWPLFRKYEANSKSFKRNVRSICFTQTKQKSETNTELKNFRPVKR